MKDVAAFLSLAGNAGVAPEPERSRSGLEVALASRRVAEPGALSPEQHFAAVAARLLAEDADG